jgi:Lon protease-like protein
MNERSLLVVLVVLTLILFNPLVDSFHVNSLVEIHQSRLIASRSLSMKWMFSKGMGSMTELGGVGQRGELYYVQSKRPTLKAPESSIGKERIIPIFPRSNVLAPLGEEDLGIYEMRYRQMMYDVRVGGTIGMVYYSPDTQKLALVGTLARIVKAEPLVDGGVNALLEGVGRFFVKDILSEKPYIKANVQAFDDYSKDNLLMQSLEVQVFNEVRYSVKIMKLMYPSNNYAMNDAVMRYRPYMPRLGTRAVTLDTIEETVRKRGRFCNAVIDMLKTDPVSKLLLLQDSLLEKRYTSLLKVLEESNAFLEVELLKRAAGASASAGAVVLPSAAALYSLRESLKSDFSDIDESLVIAAAAALDPSGSSNYINGKWIQGPVLIS